MSEDTFDVLMVCMGNICRSPMAELFARHAFDLALRDASAFHVHSAGTRGLAGWPINEPAAAVLTAAGIESGDFRARVLDAEMVESAGLVLTATRRLRGEAVTLAPRAAGWTFTLREFARLVAGADLASITATDPVERAHAVVAAAARRRGMASFAPADDDIEDPYGAEQSVFDACGAQILEALQPAIAALVGR